MAITKLKDGRYKADIRPQGYLGKRTRKIFDTKGEAVRYERHIVEQAQIASKKGEAWNPVDDPRRLNELIEIWYALHGESLNGGERRKTKLLQISEILGNPIGREFNANLFGKFRMIRRSDKAKEFGLKPVSAKTVNNDQIYLNALFNELKRLGQISYDNPISGIRPLKHVQPSMAFLTDDQITALFEELRNSRNPDVVIVSEICLRIGARWGEAEGLTSNQLVPSRNGEPCKIRLEKTKGNKIRTIPIEHDFFERLPKKSGPLFSSCFGAFRKAVARANIELPDGQMTHCLRHTFASHFMQNRGDIIVLKEILGHYSIVDTMKYAHFSPEHLEDAISKNPLALPEDKKDKKCPYCDQIQT